MNRTDGKVILTRSSLRKSEGGREFDVSYGIDAYRAAQFFPLVLAQFAKQACRAEAFDLSQSNAPRSS